MGPTTLEYLASLAAHARIAGGACGWRSVDHIAFWDARRDPAVNRIWNRLLRLGTLVLYLRTLPEGISEFEVLIRGDSGPEDRLVRLMA